MAKMNFAKLFTQRADGRYVGTYTDETGRHYLYDRDPERLWMRLNQPKREEVLTFAMVADAWEREHREEITERAWKNYEPHLKDILERIGERPLSQITGLQVAGDLKRAKAKGYSATVVQTIRSIYRMIFDFAVVRGYTTHNPVPSVKLPKGLKRGKRSAPSDEQIRTICTSVDAPFGLFPLLLLCTGLRKSEALALDRKDIDLHKREIHITKSIDYTNGANPKYKPPKTEAGVRTVPIIDLLYGPLSEALAEMRGNLLFPAPPSNRGGQGGGLMTERAYEGMWLRYCRAVGLMDGNKPAITAHHLRHGTATLMFEAKVDELTAQKILGHSRIEITRDVYTDLSQRQRAQSVQRFNDGLTRLLSKTS